MCKFVSFIVIWLSTVTPVLAHGGHDHGHPSSNLIHLLWLAPMLVSVFIVYSYFSKKRHFKNFETTKAKKELGE